MKIICLIDLLLIDCPLLFGQAGELSQFPHFTGRMVQAEDVGMSSEKPIS